MKKLVMKLLSMSLVQSLLIFFATFFIIIGFYSFYQGFGRSTTHVVIINDQGFNPKYLRVEKGDKILFQNQGNADRWPASNIHPTHDIYPDFDPKKPIAPNGSWDFKFTEVGEWSYHDHLNALTLGTIVVQDTPNGEKILLVNSLDKVFNNLIVQIKYIGVSNYFKVFPGQRALFLNSYGIKKLVDQKENSILSFLIKLYGPEQITWLLSEQSDKGNKFDCHQSAHQIGRVAFEVLGEEALKKNITFCHSGYQHGVIAMFVKGLFQSEVINKIERVCKSAGTEFNIRTCFHGGGHGLLAYLDYNLPQTISECKKIQTIWRQNSCLTGAFMENASTEFGDSLNLHKSKWINRSDAYYPCNTLDDDLQSQKACYNIQPVWVAYLYNYDMNKLVELCTGLKKELIPSCMFGFGQVVGLITSYDPIIAVGYCKELTDNNSVKSACVTGVLMGLMDNWASKMGDKGDVYCKNAPTSTREKCYEFLEVRKQELSKNFNQLGRL